VSAGLVSDCAVAPAARKQSEVDIICSAILAAYDRLAEAIEPSSGFNGATVRKVDIDKVREEVRSRGFFDANEKGHLTATSRSHFRRAKMAAIQAGKFVESDGKIWRA